MKLNRPLVVAFIFSVCWHLFFGLLFTLKLGETNPSPFKSISVSYLGRIGPPADASHLAMTQGSVLPPFGLPSLRLIEPPVLGSGLTEINRGILAQAVKKTAEQSKNISFPQFLDLEREVMEKQEPSWKLPSSLQRERKDDSFVRWEGKDREIGAKYFPPYPRWAEEEGVESEVTLRFLVSPSGRVGRVEVEKSSGYVALDVLAANYLRKWDFSPSEIDGNQVGFVIFEFSPQ